MGLAWSILWQAIRSPHRVAAIDDRRSYTYGQIVGGAMFLAEKIEGLTDAGHVGILLPTGGAFPMALLGAWFSGRVAVPLNYLLSPDELAYVIQDSRIDTVITAGPMLDFVRGDSQHTKGSSVEPIPSHIKTVAMETLDFTGVPPLRWPAAGRGDDTAVILYTSGTSGRPKGVMLTHGNLASNVDAAILHANIQQADVFLGVLPQFHSFGLTALTLIPLRIGAQAVYSARFIPKKIVELIRKHRPDIVMAVPSMYGALLSVKDAGPEDFSSIRLAISGGEPLPQATFEEYLARFHLRLLEGYGLTETAPVTNWSTPQRFVRGAVGPALPDVVIQVVDPQDRPVPPNQDGEILIAGPNVMKGYFNLPAQTQQVFVDLPTKTANGSMKPTRYFRTGDIGRLDEEGFLFITGRKKEMLIIGGENVFPREIEEVLNRHPVVKDSAVIGKMDGLRGEVPVAFVEVNEGQSFDETELRGWCRGRLAGYKVPREIRRLESLPRNPTGKILRRQLRAD